MVSFRKLASGKLENDATASDATVLLCGMNALFRWSLVLPVATQTRVLVMFSKAFNALKPPAGLVRQALEGGQETSPD